MSALEHVYHAFLKAFYHSFIYIVFLQLKALLASFGVTRYYTDGWSAYERHVEPDKHTVGKENT
jgi:IS1 family transposase